MAGDGAVDVVAVLDAGRGEFYCGKYFAGVCNGEILLTREEMLRVARGKVAIACEAAVTDSVVVDMHGAITPVAEPGAREILRVAREHFAGKLFADVAALDANYVRRSDAEIFSPSKAAKTAVSER
jgi:tRNA threonylcarbamoyladenosine biosynthesis protein TsaB